MHCPRLEQAAQVAAGKVVTPVFVPLALTVLLRCAPGDVACCTRVGTVPFRARPWVGTVERSAEKWQLPCGGEDPAGGGAEGEAAPFEGGQRLAEALVVDPESAAEGGAGARSVCGA